MLNLDTQIVIKLLLGELTDRERRLVTGDALAISDIVIWEIAKLNQLRRIELPTQSPRFESFLGEVRIFPIDLRVVTAMARLDFRSDPADEIISATSLAYGIDLLTRDARILASKVVPLAGE